MNKTLFLIIPYLICLLNCKEEKIYLYEYTLKNNTNYDLEFNSYLKTEPDYFLIKKGETLFKKSDLNPGLYNITSTTPTNLVFESRELSANKSWDIITYEYDLKYIISGSAKRVLLTWSNGIKVDNQKYSNIPDTIGFKKYGEDIYYISAQNQDNFGDVEIKMYRKDKYIKSNKVTCAYCIATLSN